MKLYEIHLREKEDKIVFEEKTHTVINFKYCKEKKWRRKGYRFFCSDGSQFAEQDVNKVLYNSCCLTSSDYIDYYIKQLVERFVAQNEEWSNKYLNAIIKAKEWLNNNDYQSKTKEY